MMASIPRLDRLPHRNGWQLLVDDKPFFLRAGELQNSSLSDADYMEGAFKRLAEMNLNAVLGSVGWEQIEPVEGLFDFNELDKVIQLARNNGTKLVLLWFGSFKNGASDYVPSWVKTDAERFPRARLWTAPGQPTQASHVISLFANDNCLQADVKAFSTLMTHLKEMDSERTVIMVQVENECGLLGDSRDRSDPADTAFNSPVPEALLKRLQSEPKETLAPSLRDLVSRAEVGGWRSEASWEQTFGNGLRTDELFMAYHYAHYVETVAAAAKAAYPLPLFSNVWLPLIGATNTLVGGGGTPGIYPSGGPVPNTLDVWRLFAPSLDFIGPDIYQDNYEEVCRDYSRGGQALFIPEQRRDERGALHLWTAVGTYGALGISPFGIDTVEPSSSPFTKHYALLRQVASLLLQTRLEGRQVFGFFFDRSSGGTVDPDAEQQVVFGEWKLIIRPAQVFGQPAPGYGMVIACSDDRYLLVGEGFQVHFDRVEAPSRPKPSFVGLKYFREIDIVADRDDPHHVTAVPKRFLNGDEVNVGRGIVAARMPSENPDYHDFHIAVTIPSRTKVAEVVPYFIEDK